MTIPRLLVVSGRRRRSLRVFASVGLAFCFYGCGGDLRTAPHPNRSISVEDGDNQSGSATAPLRKPLVVRVVDEQGEPVAAATVQWTTSDGGTFLPTTSTTDDGGF